MGADKQRRLQKKDVDTIAKALQAKGLRTVQCSKRVDAYNALSQQWICSFQWVSAIKVKGELQPAGWRFNLALLDCYSLGDLGSAIREQSRVQRIANRARSAWKAFVANRSNKRWAEYRGFVAALLLHQKIGD